MEFLENMSGSNGTLISNMDFPILCIHRDMGNPQKLKYTLPSTLLNAGFKNRYVNAYVVKTNVTADLEFRTFILCKHERFVYKSF